MGIPGRESLLLRPPSDQGQFIEETIRSVLRSLPELGLTAVFRRVGDRRTNELRTWRRNGRRYKRCLEWRNFCSDTWRRAMRDFA